MAVLIEVEALDMANQGNSQIHTTHASESASKPRRPCK
jgi:hypothetical protein